MKIEYGFSYLTSPRDIRLDNSIGQHFVLSYLNSEPNTSYGFRYRPFGIGDVVANDTVMLADRTIIKDSLTRHNHLSIRTEEEKVGQFIEDARFSVRNVHYALIQDYFYADIKDLSAIVYMLLDGLKEIKDTHKSDVLLSDKYKTIYDSIIDRLQIPTEKRNDLLGIVKHGLTQVAEEQKEEDAITTAEHIIGMVIHRPESLILGKALLAQIRFLREGIDAENLQLSSTELKETDKLVLSFADRSDFYAEDRSQDIADRIDFHAGERPQEIVAERWDLFGLLRETTPTKRAPREESIIYSLSFGNRKQKTTVLEMTLLSDKTLNSHAYNTNEDQLFTQIDSSSAHIENTSVKTSRYGKDMQIFTINKWSTWLGRDARPDTGMQYVTIGGVEGTLTTHRTYASNEIGKAATYEITHTYVDTGFVDAMRVLSSIYIDLSSSNANIVKGLQDMSSIQTVVYIDDNLVLSDLAPLLSIELWDRIVVDYDLRDKQGPSIYAAHINRFDEKYVSNSIRNIEITKDYTFVNLEQVDSRITMDYTFVENWQTNAFALEEIEKRAEKVARESMLQYLLLYATDAVKLSLIQDNWSLFKTLSPDAYQIELDLNRYATELERDGFLLNYTESGMIEKDGLIHEYVEADRIVKDTIVEYLTLMDRSLIDTILLTLIGADRQEYWNNLKIEQHLFSEINEGERGGLNLQTFTQDSWRKENVQVGLIQALINAHETSENKHEGYIKKDGYLLAGDGSDWEDIWKRYSPGVDILDPPDSDFDYSKLASSVYDLKTGVPYKPLGPTHQADVKVSTPLHHPLPEHFDLGVDDIKELVVDNFAYIDVLLAIESLKNRNTLRYAGMSAETTMRELFSKLFIWIKEAAHTDETYDRMFRFSRWYAEAIVVKMSTHVLHRTYAIWRSRFHEMEDMGIPYQAKGWSYIPSARSIQTTTDEAVLTFKQENYIDGQLIIRGYFDNPLNEGTMKIMVDNEVMYTSTKSGAFTVTLDIPQGKHNYSCMFNGNSGRVSISTIEISGCKFTSAYTTSDDSDTNGLKATTLLVSHLLTYFDTHHGESKTKGTMAIKQRRVWNTQT